MARRSQDAALVAVTVVVATAAPVLAADAAFLRGESKAWKRVATSGLADTPDHLALTTDGEFVAIEDHLPTEVGAAPYTSKDGRTWQPVSANANAFPPSAGIASLTAGNRLLAQQGRQEVDKDAPPTRPRSAAPVRTRESTAWSRDRTATWRSGTTARATA